MANEIQGGKIVPATPYAERAVADKGKAKAAAQPEVAVKVEMQAPDAGVSLQLSNNIKQLMAEPGFDAAKVESIKKAVSEGNYPMDVRRMAQSFIAMEKMIGHSPDSPNQSGGGA